MGTPIRNNIPPRKNANLRVADVLDICHLQLPRGSRRSGCHTCRRRGATIAGCCCVPLWGWWGRNIIASAPIPLRCSLCGAGRCCIHSPGWRWYARLLADCIRSAVHEAVNIPLRFVRSACLQSAVHEALRTWFLLRDPPFGPHSCAAVPSHRPGGWYCLGLGGRSRRCLCRRPHDEALGRRGTAAFSGGAGAFPARGGLAVAAGGAGGAAAASALFLCGDRPAGRRRWRQNRLCLHPFGWRVCGRCGVHHFLGTALAPWILGFHSGHTSTRQ